MDSYALELQRLQLLEQQQEIRDNLPHLYGWKFYPWARKFFDSRNQMNLLCAANQISKSSIMIRKMIEWSTNQSLWPQLWKRPPLTFWYGYPTKDVATAEFHKKIVPEFMPRGHLKDDPVYGWKPIMKAGQILAIDWNSGVTTFFKTYAQDVQDLQTGTVWAHFMDEELPEEIYSELAMRLAATDGHWHGVFTPTIGQEFWRCAIEEHGQYERFRDGLKQQVSMYDCLYYDDGTRSPWTMEQIKRAENSCKSEAEVQRRVYGRFVIDEGLKYPAFIRGRHFAKPDCDTTQWLAFIGVDPGSGGENHPAAIAVVAVSPDYTKGRVIGGWRGDGIVTTVSDVVARTQEIISLLNLQVAAIKYDYSSRDFYTIAQDLGLNVEPADKSHATGEQVVNVLFKNDMLYVYDHAELEPLAVELATLKLKTPKTKAKDDFADALRYALTAIPWDWSSINGPKIEAKEHVPTEEENRRRNALGSGPELFGVDEEIAAFNELMSSDHYSSDFGFDV